MNELVVAVRNLTVRYRTRDSTTYAVEGTSLDLHAGRVLALVGESGSGKSTVGLALLRLLPMGAEVLSGSIHFESRDLLAAPEQDLRSVRGRRMAMIFQDPVAGLNPVITIGDQVAEILTSHLRLEKKEAKRRAVGILERAGLSDPERIARNYPFQLSGGMCQRVMIGIATALDPVVLIADEPTSALDVTVQAQILYQIDDLRRQRNTAVLLITHDFGVVAQLADDVAVMYGGRVVEQGPALEILKSPLHPYTRALLDTLPRVDTRREQLRAIPGQPPQLSEPAGHCPFIPRCNKVLNACRNGPPPLLAQPEGATHGVACFNPVWQDVAAPGAG